MEFSPCGEGEARGELERGCVNSIQHRGHGDDGQEAVAAGEGLVGSNKAEVIYRQ